MPEIINFTIPTDHLVIFKTLIRTLREKIENINIICYPNTNDKKNGSIRFLSVDKTKSTLINFTLNASIFSNFICSNETTLGINLESVCKYLYQPCSVYGDYVTFCVDSEQKNILKISIDNDKKKNYTTVSYELLLLDLPNKIKNIPYYIYDAHIQLKASDFMSLCSELKVKSNLIKLECSKKEFIIKSTYDSIKRITKLNNCDIILHKDVETLKGTFDLNDLLEFKESMNMCNYLNIFMSKDKPLVIKYDIGTLGNAHILFAPIQSYFKYLKNVSPPKENTDEEVCVSKNTNNDNIVKEVSANDENIKSETIQIIDPVTNAGNEPDTNSISLQATKCSPDFLKQVSSPECYKNPNLIQFIETLSNDDLIIKNLLLTSINDKNDSNAFKNAYDILHNLQVPKKMEYNLLIAGNRKVGKTAFIERNLTDKFLDTYVPSSVSENAQQKKISFDTKYGNIKFNIYEMVDDYIPKNIDCAIVMFDKTNRNSFDMLLFNIEKIKNINIPMIVCGNKSDIDIKEWQVSITEIRKFWQFDNPCDCGYCDISTKTKINLTVPFEVLARSLIKYQDFHFIQSA